MKKSAVTPVTSRLFDLAARKLSRKTIKPLLETAGRFVPRYKFTHERGGAKLA